MHYLVRSKSNRLPPINLDGGNVLRLEGRGDEKPILPEERKSAQLVELERLKQVTVLEVREPAAKKPSTSRSTKKTSASAPTEGK